MLKLDEKEWREFSLSGQNGIFENYHGKRLIKDKRLKGTVPLLTAGEQNNGVAEFISNNEMRVFNNVISIDMFGNAFFHEYMCTGDDNIYFFINTALSKYVKLFLVDLINKNKNKFSYGKQFRQKNADTLKIVLPINKQGKPNYEYIEQYTKLIIDKKIDKYIKYAKYAKSILYSLEYKEIEKLHDKEWGEFFIDEIAYIKPGKRLTKADMIKGNKPFIGSSDSNNGITEFTSNTNQSEDFNVLGVNYNGSVVENFYHPYKAIFSDDVKRLSLKDVEGNKYLYLFIKNSILKQKSKYQYAYKFNEKRLKRQKILLPVNETKELDYEYMEQYMKNLEYKKIKQYLDYLEVIK